MYAEMYGVEKLECRVRVQKLRWFGRVATGDEEQIVREVIDMEVAGYRPIGRPRKPCRGGTI